MLDMLAPDVNNPDQSDGLAMIPEPAVVAARLTAIARERRILNRLLNLALAARDERRRLAAQGATEPVC